MQKNNIFKNVEAKAFVYLTTIAIALIILCINASTYIIPSILLFAVIVVYTLWAYNKKKNEITSYMNELTINMDSAAKNTLINSPFPLIILETDGDVIWRSSKFSKEFANVGINSYIEDITKEIKMDIDNNNIPTVDKEIDIDDKTYHVIGNYVRIKQKDKRKTSKYMMILYFIDTTDTKNLLEKYNNEKTCIGIIMIDNYDEIIQRIASEEKTVVMAEIEKMLYDWANETNGIMIKTERDTFVFIFEQKDLEKMQEEKFSILDKIKKIKTSERLQLTLSIAVSKDGSTNYEKYQTANDAMDIALGRGGDQAVLRENGNYNFFGGRAQELEKRTKVKARVVSHALEELIKDSRNVIIMGHQNGDIDSIGSSLGLFRFAKTITDEVYIVNNTKNKSIDSFIESLSEREEYNDIILDKSEALSKIDSDTLLIITDTHKKGYVEVPELLEETEKIVIIDHHRKGADFIENAILAFHEAYASSAAELVTEIIEYSSYDIELNQIEAEGLYAGIMIDTKNFTFKTGVRTFEAAAYLRKYGIDIIRIKKWFQSDLESYNVIADIVKNAEIINNSIGIAEYEEKDKNANLICAKAADELLTISNITASFVIGNQGDKVCISGRSIGDINVQIILEKLRWRRTYYTCWCTVRRNDS